MVQEMIGWQRHQLDHMQIVGTSLQKDIHASTSSLNSFTGQILFLMPKQQCQSTEGSRLSLATGSGLLCLQEWWRSIVMNMSVCVCLSVRQDISGTTRAIFTNYPVHLPVVAARSSSGMVAKFQGEATIFGVFFPTDDAL